MYQNLKELILEEQALGSSVMAKHITNCGFDEARFLIRARQELLKLESVPGLVAVLTPQRSIRRGEDETEEDFCEEKNEAEDAFDKGNPDTVPHKQTDTVLFFCEQDVVWFKKHDYFENFSVEKLEYDQAVFLCAAYHSGAVPFTFKNLPQMLGAKVVCPLGINQTFFDQYVALVKTERDRLKNTVSDSSEEHEEYSEENMKYIVRNILLWNKHASYIGKMIAHKLLKKEDPPC